MKAAFITDYGTNFSSTCKYADDVIDTPKIQDLKSTEVIVEVSEAGVNGADILLAAGIASFLVPLKF